MHCSIADVSNGGVAWMTVSCLVISCVSWLGVETLVTKLHAAFFQKTHDRFYMSIRFVFSEGSPQSNRQTRRTCSPPPFPHLRAPSLQSQVTSHIFQTKGFFSRYTREYAWTPRYVLFFRTSSLRMRKKREQSSRNEYNTHTN